MDSESGLIYLRNRYYDTATGTFITEDPIRDGLNWYSYCNDNPVKFKDENGLWASDVHYDDTYAWAVEAGFWGPNAERIAFYDNNTDNYLSGISPFPPSDQSYHFNKNPDGTDSRILHAEQKLNDAIWQWRQADINRENSIKWLNENISIDDVQYDLELQRIERQYIADKDYALRHLGEGLHAMQDYHAHGEIGVGMPVARHGKHVDDRNYDWTDSSRTKVEWSSNQNRYNNTKVSTMVYLNRFLNAIR